ncbi:uncharacterized protein EI90DRAFT_3019431 [Cantharellus anzutake]|uniref:uncharacterized protein n=1 Tax=Cantharellus anzutake TaxID=1750568 RepID=UPI0019037907|nr:uncharacterized protein EI90DRAFT_3019431 [Cantharellus anzutake]KAF8324668.1 hypothetical protein EI90DRAFT_3019431 [Cantharellus anzutake]
MSPTKEGYGLPRGYRYQKEFDFLSLSVDTGVATLEVNEELRMPEKDVANQKGLVKTCGSYEVHSSSSLSPSVAPFSPPASPNVAVARSRSTMTVKSPSWAIASASPFAVSSSELSYPSSTPRTSCCG